MLKSIKDCGKNPHEIEAAPTKPARPNVQARTLTSDILSPCSCCLAPQRHLKARLPAFRGPLLDFMLGRNKCSKKERPTTSTLMPTAHSLPRHAKTLAWCLENRRVEKCTPPRISGRSSEKPQLSLRPVGIHLGDCYCGYGDRFGQ